MSIVDFIFVDRLTVQSVPLFLFNMLVVSILIQDFAKLSQGNQIELTQAGKTNRMLLSTIIGQSEQSETSEIRLCEFPVAIICHFQLLERLC
jgi:hypothetical protein